MALDSTQIDQLAERRGTDNHVLLLIEPLNRQTGATEPMGLWSGDDHQFFNVDGDLQFFFGAGAVIDVPMIRAGVGLDVRRHRVLLPPMLDEVKLALQVYQAAQAPARVWVQPMDIDSGLPRGTPHRVIKGRLERAPETLGKLGDETSTELVISDATRDLTFTQPLFKSDAALRLGDPNDRAREYVDAIGDRAIPWGQDSVVTEVPPPPPAPSKDGIGG